MSQQKAIEWLCRRLSRGLIPTWRAEEELRKRGLPTDVIPEMVTRGFLDDEEWARMVIAVSLRRGQGPNYIRQKLRAKGAREEDIARWVGEIPAERVKEAFLVAWRKRNGQKELVPKDRAALYRKGFSYESQFML